MHEIFRIIFVICAAERLLLFLQKLSPCRIGFKYRLFQIIQFEEAIQQTDMRGYLQQICRIPLSVNIDLIPQTVLHQ